jgi:hypothetical protein
MRIDSPVGAQILTSAASLCLVRTLFGTLEKSSNALLGLAVWVGFEECPQLGDELRGVHAARAQRGLTGDAPARARASEHLATNDVVDVPAVVALRGLAQLLTSPSGVRHCCLWSNQKKTKASTTRVTAREMCRSCGDIRSGGVVSGDDRLIGNRGLRATLCDTA